MPTKQEWLQSCAVESLRRILRNYGGHESAPDGVIADSLLSGVIDIDGVGQISVDEIKAEIDRRVS